MKILIAPFARPLRNNEVSPKNYPYAKELVELLCQDGHLVTQVGASEEEKVCEETRLGLPHDKVLRLLEESDTFIAVDSYLQHAAWSIGKRGIVLWSVSDPKIFGHDLHINLLKDRNNLRPDQFNTYEGAQYKDFVEPEEVVRNLVNV